ncbi:extracellular solute-binding protein [Clostridium frigoris]|uniref:Extracellular solute-binding protein n=1 Tax=Clostridium frigoris TaxID=205327 RepID=A0ABS6BNF1_9CLOT|nr:extracellular solute-binding protein [Clostridium frigoris]MBU3158451.1 extracellular solute-binding protein [Clostridium frigoris]
MKKNNLKMLCMLTLTTVLATSVLAGCGSKASTATTSTTDNTKPVTLKLITWTNPATVNAIKVLNDNFTKKYPNIKVKIDSVDSATYPNLVQTRIAASDADIIAQQQFVANPVYTKGLDKPPFQQYVENGDFLDLSNEAFIKNYDQNAIKDSSSFNGKVYAIPVSKVSYNGVFYNKTIFEQNKLKVPQTWDEFMSICKTLQDKGIAPLTAGGKDGWPIGAIAANAVVSTAISDPTSYMKGLWAGNKKLNDAESLVIFDRLAQLSSYYEKGVMGVDYASVPGRFAAGKAAMLTDGAWQAPQIAKADPNLKFGYFPMPSTSKGSDVAQLKGKYDTLFAASGKSKNKDAELKWLAFMSEKENYTTFINAIAMEPTMTGVTSNDAFLKSLAPMSKDFQLDFELVYRAPKGMGKFGGFQPTQLKTLGGTVSSSKALADLAQKDWDTAVKVAK